MSDCVESEPGELGLTRVVGAIGRFMISSGMLVLAFAAYQLWGTGLLQDRAQADLAAAFEQFEGEGVWARAPVAHPESDIQSSPDGGPDTPEEPLGAPDTEPSALVVPAAAIEREAGQVVGRVTADRIDLDQYVVEGVGPTELRAGPGHYPGTPMPGMAGNASLAGHRTTWGAPFNRIDELLPGDEVIVDMPWGSAIYVVDTYTTDDGEEVGHFIVDPSEVGVLDQDGTNRLTLTSCHPKFSARQRIIVTATLISDPVVLEGDFEPKLPPSLADEDLDLAATPETTTPPPPARLDGLADVEASIPGASNATTATGIAEESFGEGLGGDRTAIGPAMAWSLAAISAWLTAKFAARRLRRRIPYVVAAVPIAALWFVAFSFIDRAIPSY